MDLNQIEQLKSQVLTGKLISYDQAVGLSKTPHKEALYKVADAIRRHFCGDQIDLCSITNARSGRCTADCKWCAQSIHFKTNIETYDLIDEKEALEQAQHNYDKGVHRYSLVTSGRAISNKNLDKLIKIYEKIKKRTPISLCASMGLLSENQLMKLKKVGGIEHYHCNLETAPSYFDKVVTSHTFQEKVQTIQWAKEQGFKICSGGILGMGETMEQRIEMAIELQKLDVQSIPLNILTPVDGTPLENATPLSDEEVLTTFALFRFINPKANIRLAGGRIRIKHIEKNALKAGISAALVGDLLTTVGTNVEEDVYNFKEAGLKIADNYYDHSRTSGV